MAQIRLPNITGVTQAERISQIQSYLYQLVYELQWILDTMESGGGNTAAAGTATSSPGQSLGETEFRELQPLIIQSTAIFEAYYNKGTAKLEESNVYAKESNFPGGSAAFAKKISDALEEAGALEDGKDGKDGEDGASAYEIALAYGFDGTVEEWLASLEGESAYEIALANGFEGTEEEWLASLGSNVILTSPSGMRYKMTVDDSGSITAVLV